jgi:quercetin dioxygenase-like cupin family protein
VAKKPVMEPIAVDDYVEFHDEEFYANKIVDGEDMRVLAFAFKAGQEMEVVRVRPSVMLYAFRGEGFFTVGKREFPVRPGQFVVVAPDEPHGVRAGRREEFVALVVIAPSPTGMLE